MAERQLEPNLGVKALPEKLDRVCSEFLKPFSDFRPKSLICSTLFHTLLESPSRLTRACEDKPLPHMHTLHLIILQNCFFFFL